MQNLENYQTFYFKISFLINDKLNWKSHINFLISKVNKYRAIIFLVRNNLTKNSLKLIYHSLVYSNILYGNVIWGNSNLTTLRPLIIAQKKLIRTIMFRDRYAHTNDDFYSLGILKLVDVNFFAYSNL